MLCGPDLRGHGGPHGERGLAPHKERPGEFQRNDVHSHRVVSGEAGKQLENVFPPGKEALEALFGRPGIYTVRDGKAAVPIGGRPVVAVINWKPGEAHTVKVGTAEIDAGEPAQPLTLIVDNSIVEYFGDGGKYPCF